MWFFRRHPTEEREPGEATLSPELLARIKTIQLRTQRLVTDALAGEYHSAFKGRGMEFEQVREYAPGDDIRHIDWNVTARMSSPFVKEHREERELTVMLIVDVSSSGAFGTAGKQKREVVAEVAAVLAYLAIQNNDRVGMIVFSDRIERFIPPKKGRSHVWRVIREVLSFRPAGRGTDLDGALDYLGRVVPRRSVGFVVSDFLDEGFSERLRVAARRHDLTAIRVLDRREVGLPRMGLIELEDAETGETMVIDTASRRVAESFAGAANADLARRSEQFRQAGVGEIQVWADRPWIEPIVRYLRARERGWRDSVPSVKQSASPSSGARTARTVRVPARAGALSALLPALVLPLALACGAAGDRVDPAEPPKPPAELRAAVDRTTATTGDLIVYEVEVEREPDVSVELADPGTGIAGFRIVDLGEDPPETLASGRILERRWFQLRADLIGSYALPALSATYSGPDGDEGGLAAPEIPVEVESVLPADGAEATDIRDIKPLRRIEAGPPWPLWMGVAAAVLALAAAAWWWRRRRQRGGGGPETPRIPPWELAIQELERLRRTDFSNLRELRRYYFAVSAVVRAYVEGRFGMNATDLTTEEILSRLGGLARLDRVEARRLKRFLLATDRVKFAAHLPGPEEIERTWEQALGFVRATRPPEDDGGEDGRGAAEEAAPANRGGKAA